MKKNNNKSGIPPGKLDSTLSSGSHALANTYVRGSWVLSNLNTYLDGLILDGQGEDINIQSMIINFELEAFECAHKTHIAYVQGGTFNGGNATFQGDIQAFLDTVITGSFQFQYIGTFDSKIVTVDDTTVLAHSIKKSLDLTTLMKRVVSNIVKAKRLGLTVPEMNLIAITEVAITTGATINYTVGRATKYKVTQASI